MMRNRVMTLALALIGVLTVSVGAFGQTQSDLFNGDIFHEVRLYIAPQDYMTLKETNFTCEDQDIDALEGAVISPVPRIECWFPVEFHWKFNGADITGPQVGVASHGKGSRSSIKPSFKIDFSRYESRNTFLGLRYLVLRADTQDASLMHERIAMEFFNKLGMPAPRETHTRLFINDQYAGVYTIVEEVDPIFVQQRFGESDGYLYSYEYTFPWVYQYLGPDSSKYSPLPYKPENNLTNYQTGPFEGMAVAINQSPDAQFASSVSQYLDTDVLFRELAAENFIAEEDGIIGNYGVNNHYLYRFQNSVRATYIPWDKSNTFWAPDWDILRNFFTNVLTLRAFYVAPSFMSLYKTTLLQAADVAGGAGGWLQQEIMKVYQQIRQAVYDDTLKLCDEGATGTLHSCSNAEFEAEVTRMLQFAQQRADFVRSQIASGLLPR